MSVNVRRWRARSLTEAVRALLLLALAALAAADNLLHPFSIELRSGARECFFESLNPSDVRSLMYEVWQGEDFLVNVKILGPDLQVFYDRDGTEGEASVLARMQGEHSFCFENKWGDRSRVSFNLLSPESTPDKSPSALTPLLSSLETISNAISNATSQVDHFDLVQKRSIYMAVRLHDTVNRLSLAKLLSVMLSSVVTVVVVRSLFAEQPGFQTRGNEYRSRLKSSYS
ncbi:hypothetical protein M427DRAFT_143960 [Gonapodya prolifera JEL478]|uniref:GOLD domain-containing protein n=1 Tax=Gonapodya prolifera (strain JEL478) TaxID=1344416 RepID=A0A139AN51_GONPJ|nr:hypothetical protein M427DRAFT_143960 [Gonapodya prolifera JEL478]|eukprot:KXS18191.1 hypothetical protein M427DRAFT_143960 [Gonapodya prolifera JEL478]